MTKQGDHARPRRIKPDPAPEPSPYLRLLWLVGLVVFGLVTASLLSFDPADPPGHAVAPLNPPGDLSNWIGSTGAFIAHHTYLTLGSGVWCIILAAAGALVFVAYRGPITQPTLRALGVVILSICASSLHALLAPTFTPMPQGAGGLVAQLFADTLASRFGALGAFMWIALFAAIGATIAFDRWLILFPAYAAHAIDRFIHNPARILAPIISERARAARASLASRAPRPVNAIDYACPPSPTAVVTTRRAMPRKPEILPAEPDQQAEDEELPGAPQVYSEQELQTKLEKLDVRFAAHEPRSADESDLESLRAMRESEEEAERRYQFPSLELLVDPESNFNETLEQAVRTQARTLEAALRTYSIKGHVVGIQSGPVITLYQIRLAPGTKVSSVTAIASDLARSLKAINIRVVPNIEGSDSIGIEVPNPYKEKVRLKELMTSCEETAKMRIPLFLGKDASGAPLVVDLAKMPHMLIAGTTGSGKSVCMSAIIMGFLYTQKPSDLKLVLVDPKMVELSQFKNIPHLMCPVVTEMPKAVAILEWAVTKMDERYQLLAEAGCRDIIAYNELDWEEKKEALQITSEAEEARVPKKLPYLVFVIDELADMMMTNKEVETAIVRIAQKARAVGIHLILATQRPQANVVTGLIKSNMPARVAFKVSSGMDSRIVLDQKGGELLLGSGDMLMITPQSTTALRAQGTLVDDKEIRRVVNHVRDLAPMYERSLVQIGHAYSGDGTGEDGEMVGKPASDLTAEEHESRMRQSAQEDPLFDRAVEIVLETQRGSVSLLQRRLAIGYTRASRLIDLMGFAGIIGQHKGSVAREVMMSIEQWDAMKRLHADRETEAQRPITDDNTPSLFQPEEPDQTETLDIESTPLPDPQAPTQITEPKPAVITIEPEDASELVEEEEAEEEYEEAEDEYEAEEDEEDDEEPADELEEDDDDEEYEVIDEDEEEDEEEEDEAPEADSELVDEEEEEEDEEEYEYEYVDENGNPIDPEDADEYEYEVVDEDEEDDEKSKTDSKVDIRTTRVSPNPSHRGSAA